MDTDLMEPISHSCASWRAGAPASTVQTSGKVQQTQLSRLRGRRRPRSTKRQIDQGTVPNMWQHNR
eukprot:55541-Eustigmatos_ZCMA.PRE.1